MLVGVDAPAPRSQLSMVSLSFPVIAPVLNTIRPLVVVALTPKIVQYLTAFRDASLMNCRTPPPVLVFEMVRLFVEPVLLTRPSIVTLSASFKLMTGAAKFPVMVKPVTVGYMTTDV